MTDLPPQPRLTEGPITLRPWRVEDADEAREQHDQEIAHWFGFPQVVPPRERQLQAIEDWHAGYADDRRVVGFVVEVDNQVAGTVELRRTPGRDATGHLSWAIFPRFRGQGYGAHALRLLVDYAFREVGLVRVEAYIDPRNTASLRTASRAGLRKEGVVRGYEQRGGERTDALLVSRLVDDPPVGSREQFIAGLNALMPRTRAIAQALIHDGEGRVLVCQLVYKKQWDLPGGIVDAGESPAQTVLRELHEELGVVGRVRSLPVVSWLPPWRGWDDALLFLFHVEVDPCDLDVATLQEREIRDVHWVDRDTLVDRAADYTVRLVDRGLEVLRTSEGTAYLEDGDDPLWAG